MEIKDCKIDGVSILHLELEASINGEIVVRNIKGELRVDKACVATIGAPGVYLSPVGLAAAKALLQDLEKQFVELTKMGTTTTTTPLVPDVGP